jgi:hypothetical protein
VGNALGLLPRFCFHRNIGHGHRRAEIRGLLHEGAYEIRDFQAAVAAEVSVTGDQRAAARKGYIAMTAPVAQERIGEKIAMTAPVTQTQADAAWVARFTMPGAYSLETLPEPNGPMVKLRAVAAARFAVIRFSGLVSRAEAINRAPKVGDLTLGLGPRTSVSSK